MGPGLLRVLTTVLLGGALTACQGFKVTDPSSDGVFDAGGGGALLSPTALESKAMAVLQNRCAACHNPLSVNGGLGDVTDKSHLLSQGFVVPGGATNSQLYDSIANNRMPTGAPLSEDEKTAIRSWIIEALPALPPPAVSIATTRSIVQARCLSCHSVAGGLQGGINLETDSGIRAMVVPGEPFQSPLFDAVLKERMPKNLESLSVRELAVIYSWIFAGASLDN